MLPILLLFSIALLMLLGCYICNQYIDRKWLIAAYERAKSSCSEASTEEEKSIAQARYEVIVTLLQCSAAKVVQ